MKRRRSRAASSVILADITRPKRGGQFDDGSLLVGVRARAVPQCQVEKERTRRLQPPGEG